MPVEQHRAMCFTINNYTEEQVQAVKTCSCKAITAGYEVGPKSGTPHIQGAVIWEKQLSFKAAQERLGGPCGTIKMEGSFESNIKYTQKDGKCVRLDDNRKQGSRTDIEGMRDRIKRGADDLELITECAEPLAKYPKFAEKCRQVYHKELSKEFRQLEIIVRWGEAGTGKSRAAFEDGAYAVASYSPEWWDGYDGERTILFDDFYGQIKFCRLLRLLDGYSIALPVKGGFRYALYTKVYITSNVHPEAWYPNIPEQSRLGLMRRITEIIELKHDN